MKRLLRPALGLFALLASIAPASAQTRLLRYPDIHGEEVVFTYAGDLWLAPAGGGTARRLTAHPGLELFGRFSPDGEWVAFTGQYDGDEQVYVVPARGGMPRQLTFYPAQGPLAPRWGYDNQVYGWTPDGSAVLFRSLRDGWDLSDSRLYTVGLDGALPEALPMPVSGGGDLSPDGRKAVYSPLFRDFRHWKRYEGGWAQDLWVFDLEALTAERITDHPRSDRDPMWIGERIYFTSDRTGTLNLFVYDPASGETRQLTDSTLWDLRWPASDGASRIVYELQGELQVYDIGTGASRPAPIFVPDDGLGRRPARVPAEGSIEDFHLSPAGQRALFTARGDVFTAPVEHGTTRNLTRSSSAHDREAAWSPDGKTIAFVSDRDGEEEIWRVDQAGRGAAEQLTDGSTGRKYDLLWAPDGERLAWRDQRGKLYVLELESRRVIEVADDPDNFGLTYSWSPDGAHLAFSLADDTELRSLFIWTVGAEGPRRITGPMFNEFEPVFDPSGDYLFYLSDREFAPQIGSFEFNYAVDRETYLYAMALREDVAHPFPPRSDEATVADEEGAPDASEEDRAEERGRRGRRKAAEEKEAEPEEEPKPVRIDFEGLERRVARVPVEAGNYGGLAAIDGHLLYTDAGAFYYGRESDFAPELWIFSREKREEALLAEEIGGYRLSADGTKVLVRGENGFTLFDATFEGAGTGKPISTGGLAVDRVPSEEWTQIFHEVWRRFRDFFYVENMHGYDWEGLRDRYGALLEHVAHRSDLNYLISEMIAELSASHTYIAGGDYRVPDRPRSALLGARLEADPASGRYRIDRIFAGQNEEEAYRSPLTEIGVGAAVGDYLLEINGVELTTEDNPYRLLRHAGGSPVELALNDRPALDGARRVVVDPISSEDDLLYLAWIDANRRWVAERSGGRVGYLHLPNMGSSGIREFIKWFYGQIRLQGLIVDVRSNGGGNVSPMILERLQRKVLMVDFERNIDFPEPTPGTVFHGHMVCLMDEDTASDGDQFAWMFRAAGLGPLIGKRSWGGVVGIYGRGPLIDGGSVWVPEAGTADPSGAWVIEGHGVDPDVVVENDPGEVLRGRDQQLEKGLEMLLARIEQEPRALPGRPADPVKVP